MKKSRNIEIALFNKNPPSLGASFKARIFARENIWGEHPLHLKSTTGYNVENDSCSEQFFLEEKAVPPIMKLAGARGALFFGKEFVRGFE
ncbi:MAG TPA: hypothetical protein VN873_12475 [Candidatus Angelobacter sp.]|nr:hypothetical protein [Candidatus Angelobacter sp.]